METAHPKSSQLGPVPIPPPYNPWDKWLYMELKWRSTTHATQVCVDLTINFGEDWYLTSIGKLKFGFSGGDLNLKLQNGIMPIGKRNPKNNLQQEVKVKRILEEVETSQGREWNAGVKTGVKIDPAAVEPSIALDLTSKSGDKREEKTQDEFYLSKWQITVKGSPDKPVWSFEVQSGEPVLEGILADYELGVVDITGTPCSLFAQFNVSESEIVFTKREGVLTGLTRNRDALVTMLVRKHIWNKLQPYVSSAEMSYAQ